MKGWVAILMVTTLWAALYLPFLGALEIRGEEARRILPARTMLQTGDWIVLHIGGKVYSRKPPLINWSIAASFLATGEQSEWSARLPSVLWLLAFALTAALSLRRSLGNWGAASVGLFVLSTIAIMDKGRMAEIEAMYLAQTGIAFVLWANWWSAGKHWLAYTIPWIFLGLGMLAKGPVHLIFFYGTVLPGLILSRRVRDLWSAPHLIGLVIMGAVFLPWTIANLQQTNAAAETSGVWADQLLQRLRLSKIPWGDWLLRPFNVLGDFLPWTIPLAWTWWKVGRIGTEAGAGATVQRWDTLIRGSRIGLLAGIGLTLLMPHGEARYCQPLFPMAAVILVDHWRRLLDGQRRRAENLWEGLNVAGAWIVVVLAAASTLIVPRFNEGQGVLVGIAGTIVALIMVFLPRSIRLGGSKLPPLAVTCLVFATGAAVALAHARGMVERPGDYRSTGREMKTLMPARDRLIVFYNPQHLRSIFYLDQPYVEAARIADMPETPGYLVIRPKDFVLEKVKRYLRPFEAEELGRPNWEGQEFIVLKLNPHPTTDGRR